MADRDGTFLFMNSGAERIFGYTAAEAMGRSLDLIIPENLRERHWQGYRRVMESGETRYATGLLSSPGIRKNSNRVSLELSMVLLRDRNGDMQGCGSIMRDVTERWKREKEMSLTPVAPGVVADESTARMFVGVIFRGRGGKAHPDGEYG